MQRLLAASLLCLLLNSLQASSQVRAVTFEQAAKAGFSYQHLDSLYKSAVHSEAKLAVFKSADEQAKLQQAYAKLINELGIFLQSNGFKWEKQTRCFNRIYFTPAGKIDYFLYSFPKDELAPQKEKEFGRLLNQFIKDHRIAITAAENFAQCSPIKYNDL